jgi:hypothetical protein
MSFTLSFKNRQKLASLHADRYSVQHKNKKYSISAADRVKIKIATTVGALFFGVGSIFAEHLARNYFCNQLKNQIRSEEVAKQRHRFNNQSVKMRDRANDLEKRARKFQLKKLPAKKERFASSIHPLNIKSRHATYNYYTKKTDEILPPTIKAALWRRAYLYR